MRCKINKFWSFRRTDIAGEKFKTVVLPHDWAIEGDFSENNCIDAVWEESHLEYRHDSYLPRGTGEYRKNLEIPQLFPEQKVFLEFDGVFGESSLYVDGQFAGENHSGYTGKVYDITSFAAGKNSVELQMPVSAERMQGWWYEGAGIYRHVWLMVKPACHLAPWGVAVDTPEVSPKQAVVEVSAEICNAAADATTAKVTVEVSAPDGGVISSLSKEISLAPGTVSVEKFTISTDNPELWDVDSPRLYHARIKVDSVAGSDEITVPFGIRFFQFTADRGFFLNGRHLQLRGGNIHHDFGGMGTALPDRAHEKNVEVLKEMGCNIIRSSHNPAAPALMEACDRLGMLFWAETRNLHTDRGGIDDLTALIRRDRNHPSIILWSLANIGGAENGNRHLTEKLQELHDHCKKLDPFRPTAVGLEGNADANANGFAMVTDVVGYNGGGMGIDERDHRDYPERCMVISEFASGRGARGVYQAESASGEIETLGDGRVFPRNGCRATEQDLINAHIKEWSHIMPRNYLAGGLMWSAIEYRGETCGWPIVTSQFGVLDICRFPKDVYYYYKKLWTTEPVLHIFPPWNHDVPTGTMVELCCFSNCDYVEVSLNGKKIDGFPEYLQRGSTFPYMNWHIPFDRGEVVAVGYNAGQEVCRRVLRTPEKPSALRITADRQILKADGEDIAFLRIDVVDVNGTFVPDAHELLSVKVDGAGELAGMCSGDPAGHEKESASQMHTFNGSLLAIIRSTEQAGGIKVSVESAGGLSAAICLQTSKEKEK